MYASELQELVRKNPEKYNGKQYTITSGISITQNGYIFECVFISKNGMFVNIGGVPLFFSTDTQLEEVRQKVSFFEAISDYTKNIASADIKEDSWDTFDSVYFTLRCLTDLLYDERYDLYEKLINGKWYIK